MCVGQTGEHRPAKRLKLSHNSAGSADIESHDVTCSWYNAAVSTVVLDTLCACSTE